jgi:hypothetical protein
MLGLIWLDAILGRVTRQELIPRKPPFEPIATFDAGADVLGVKRPAAS